MKKIRFVLLGLLCLATTPAFAGLFSDAEARQQIKQLEVRLAQTEETLARLETANKQQTSALLDLQTLIDSLNAELRKQRGQNEELVHSLQDAEKRQKDFYVDLDGRLRRFEAADTPSSDKASVTKNKTDDSAAENRAFEAAYGFYKAERYPNAVSAFQDFLKNYPKSANTANVRYWMGNAYFVLKDFKNSLESYQILASKFDSYPKMADVYFSIADCQESLNNKEAAKNTLKQITIKFPNSEAAAKAKKELAALK